MQHHPAHELHVEVPLPDRALGGLAREREGVREEVVERLAVTRALAQLVGLLPQLRVLQQLHLGLEVVDPRDAALELLELLALADAQSALENRH